MRRIQRFGKPYEFSFNTATKEELSDLAMQMICAIRRVSVVCCSWQLPPVPGVEMSTSFLTNSHV
jgi:hypothetical protein